MAPSKSRTRGPHTAGYGESCLLPSGRQSLAGYMLAGAIGVYACRALERHYELPIITFDIDVGGTHQLTVSISQLFTTGYSNSLPGYLLYWTLRVRRDSRPSWEVKPASTTFPQLSVISPCFYLFFPDWKDFTLHSIPGTPEGSGVLLLWHPRSHWMPAQACMAKRCIS